MPTRDRIVKPMEPPDMQRETAQYIADMVLELRSLARATDLNMDFRS